MTSHKMASLTITITLTKEGVGWEVRTFGMVVFKELCQFKMPMELLRTLILVLKISTIYTSFGIKHSTFKQMDTLTILTPIQTWLQESDCILEIKVLCAKSRLRIGLLNLSTSHKQLLMMNT